MCCHSRYLRLENPMRIIVFRAALAVSVTLAACSSGPPADSSRDEKNANSATTLAATASGDTSADSAQIGRLANQVARRVLRIRRGDVVMIVGGTHTIPTMEALALETEKAGGLESMLLLSDRVTRAVLRQVPEENLGTPATYFAEWLRSTTVYIGLPAAADPKGTFAEVPEAKLAKWFARFDATYDMLNGSRVRGTYIDYPSAGAAAAVGMEPDVYTRMQLAAIGADPGAMAQSGRALEAKFRNARSVRITSPAGTDFKVTLANRSAIVDAGMLEPGAEREKIFAKRWVVLPGGNVGVAPRETSATGVIVTPKDICKFRPVRDARYEFSDGKVTSVTAKEGEACLKEVLEPYGPGIKQVGSLGVGLNPELKVVEEGGDYRPWNAAGMVGVFLGDNTLMGGTNKVKAAAGVGLPIPRATVEVDGEVVVRDGKLVSSEVAASQR
ncbi:MAG: aminopeptidase [Gemmatimonadales bacterium]